MPDLISSLHCENCCANTLNFSDFWDTHRWTHQMKCRTCGHIVEQPFTDQEEQEAAAGPTLVTAWWYVLRQRQQQRQAPAG